MKRVLVATSNAGKLRDLTGAALPFQIEIVPLPLADLPSVIEDGATFEANARKKAEAYSRYAPSEIVIADDSGLEVDGLDGAPGVHSARYAADERETVIGVGHEQLQRLEAAVLQQVGPVVADEPEGIGEVVHVITPSVLQRRRYNARTPGVSGTWRPRMDRCRGSSMGCPSRFE